MRDYLDNKLDPLNLYKRFKPGKVVKIRESL